MRPVAVGHLADILLRTPGSHDGPGAAVLPQVDVVLGVEGHHPLAGGAGGGLDADALLQGLGYQPVGVGLPLVSLGDNMFIQDLSATILCCTPSYAAYIGETMKEMGLTPDQIPLKAGIFGAEAWSEEIFTWVRPQEHFSRVSMQMSRVR